MHYLIPVSINDIEIARLAINSIKKNDSNSKIVVIIKSNYKQHFVDLEIDVLEEDNLIEGLTYKNLESLMINIHNTNKRVGWYFQQFIKMAYSLITNNDYIVWDSDTIMLNRIDFYESNKYVLFHTNQNEHNAYAETFKRIFPSLKFESSKSFIAEKMIISQRIMQEIIASIESKYGKPFFQAILENIESPEIQNSSFSEFATYSNYVLNNYFDKLVIRDSKHFRDGKKIFGELPTIEALSSISELYDSVSIEKWQTRTRLSDKTIEFIRHLFGTRISLTLIIKIDSIINRLSLVNNYLKKFRRL
jgi:hypothetical protein